MTREEAIKYIKSRCIGSTEERDGTQWSEAMWTAIEALADRPTESDFISKAKVLETYSELYWFDSDCGVVSKEEVDKIYERLQSLPSAEPCDKDAISRDGLLKSWEELSPRGRTEFDQVIMTIPALPSADRPTGEWVRKYDKQINYYWYECNQCGEYRPRNVIGKEWSSPYCPKCGAKMYKGGDDE